MRAGRYIKQKSGYRAFIPAPLPPDPPLRIDAVTTKLLSDADRALGRLDGVATVLPNPDLFVAMYVRQEAVLSSQIEGTQSTLEDVLDYEAGGQVDNKPRDVEEVVNYVGAINHGLARLPELPLSLRLIREVHEKLMTGVRGQERQPGEFRRSQNWIGPQGCTLNDAEFIPPPPEDMNDALGDFEKFLHKRDSMPELIHCALAHAQFETIHPFLDGNGRVGRLLITLLLCERKILSRPLLYLSHYFKAHRAQYYDRLTAIRNDGDWEGWLAFFLKGVCDVSLGATDTAKAILKLQQGHRELASSIRGNTGNSLTLLESLYTRPVINVRFAEQLLNCSYPTANNLLDALTEKGILREITGAKRNRRWRYDQYMELFQRQALRGLPESDSDGRATQQTNTS
ncbi:MAG: Fic family protein [Limisphaerales bacterium]|jgi:Fic family protein